MSQPLQKEEAHVKNEKKKKKKPQEFELRRKELIMCGNLYIVLSSELIFLGYGSLSHF